MGTMWNRERISDKSGWSGNKTAAEIKNKKGRLGL